MGKLPDGHLHEEDLEAIVKVVEDFCREKKADLILTFDDSGVSGHKDHVSCCLAVQALMTSGRMNSEINV